MKYSPTIQSSPASSSTPGSSSITQSPCKNHLAATAIAGLLSLACLGPSQAGDLTAEHRMMKPLNAISFDVGLKHVVSYFLTRGGQCDLTVLVSDQLQEVTEFRELPSLHPTRISTLIDTGKKVHIDAAEGQTLEFFCLTGSRSMSVREVRQVAYTAGVSR